MGANREKEKERRLDRYTAMLVGQMQMRDVDS